MPHLEIVEIRARGPTLIEGPVLPHLNEIGPITKHRLRSGNEVLVSDGVDARCQEHLSGFRRAESGDASKQRIDVEGCFCPRPSLSDASEWDVRWPPMRRRWRPPELALGAISGRGPWSISRDGPIVLLPR